MFLIFVNPIIERNDNMQEIDEECRKKKLSQQRLP